MESCIVCLECSEDISARITTLSTEWIDGKLQRIIEKHLWWWYMKPASQSNGYVQWICRQCWHELSTFHRFFGKVEKAHRYYKPLESTLEKVNRKGKRQIRVKLKNKRSLRKQDSCKENVRDAEGVTEFCSRPNTCEENEEAAIEEIYLEHEPEVNDSSCSEIQEDDPVTQNGEISEFVIEIKNTEYTLNKSNAAKKSKRTGAIRNSSSEPVSVAHSVNESPHNLECSICDASLPNFRLLKAHYRNVHNTKGYAMCCGNKYFQRCMLYDHLKVHKDPDFFKCHLCAKTYATRRGFKTHLETHEIRERKYTCECGKSFFKLRVYERHKLLHLPESEKHFNCSQCCKKFASAYLRRQHEVSTHDRKYTKICEMCGKTFSSNDSFLRHMEEHAGKPPSFETCEICGAKLTNKKGLRHHMKMQHLEENLQEMICPYCARVSPNTNAHLKHIKYTHVMQRKHACHMCDKAFRQALELKEHLCSHTGEALYTCTYCPRTFISHSNMYKHRKIAHHKEWEESRLNKLNRFDYKSVRSEIFTKVSTLENS